MSGWRTSGWRRATPRRNTLGQLDDAALQAEASTWNGLIHPIFCLPRGSSTKLAGAIAWGLPVLTTPQGRRGYEWQDVALTEVDTPETFVAATQYLTASGADIVAAAAVARVAASSPTTVDVAARINTSLATISAAAVETGTNP